MIKIFSSTYLNKKFNNYTFPKYNFFGILRAPIEWSICMKLNFFVAILLFCFSTTSFAEGLWTHSCDPKSAWFSEKINSGIQTASLDTETLLKVDELTVQCHYEVNLGISTYETAKCKKALDLVGYN